MDPSGICNSPDPAREAVRERIATFLTARGFSDQEISFNHEFTVELDGNINAIRIEILVSLEGRVVMLVKCINGFLVTRERATLAMARLFFEYTVPLAVVANNRDAVVMDTSTGKTIGYGLEAIPSRNELKELTKKIAFSAIPDERREGEKRILFTFLNLWCEPKDCEPF
jgi:hypothetical protein